MATTAIKNKGKVLNKPSSGKTKTPNMVIKPKRKGNAPAGKVRKRGKAQKSSPWTAIAIFLIFAGLVVYMFSPNVPTAQKAPKAGFATGLTNK